MPLRRERPRRPTAPAGMRSSAPELGPPWPHAVGFRPDDVRGPSPVVGCALPSRGVGKRKPGGGHHLLRVVPCHTRVRVDPRFLSTGADQSRCRTSADGGGRGIAQTSLCQMLGATAPHVALPRDSLGRRSAVARASGLRRPLSLLSPAWDGPARVHAWPDPRRRRVRRASPARGGRRTRPPPGGSAH